MSAKGIISLFGATAGAYSQDPNDHPLAGIAGAAIGGYIGAKVSTDIFDTYKQLVPNRLTADAITRRRVDVNAATDMSIVDARKTIATRMNKVISNPGDYELHRGNLSTMIDDRFSSAADADQLIEKMETYLDDIDGNRKKMLQFADIISNKNAISAISAAPVGASTGISSYIGAGDSLKQVQDKVKKHYKGLGVSNTRERKALAENMASFLHGRATSIDDYTMTMFSNTDNPMKMQLTGTMDSGERISMKNNITYIAKSINPYAGMLADDMPLIDATGKKTAVGVTSTAGGISATQRFRAEELPALMMKANNGTITDDEIRALNPMMQKSFLHSSNDARMGRYGQISGFGKRIAQTLEYEDIIEQYYDDSGSLRARMKKLNTRIEGDASRSQGSIALNKVQDVLGYNPLHGQNISALTGITLEDKMERLYSPGFFQSSSRQQSYVNYREVRQYETSDSEWLKYKKKQYEINRKYNIEELQRSSAQGERIQMSNQLAELAPSMFGQEQVARVNKAGIPLEDKNGKVLMEAGRGNTYAIADGHGLLNANQKSKFFGTQDVSLKIGDMGDELNSKYMLSFNTGEGMKSIEELMGMDKDLMEDYLENNRISINSGQTIGYSKEGKPVQLKKHFTNGILQSINRTEEGLSLSFKGIHTPDDWIKIFGTAAKSGLSEATSKDFMQMGAVSLAEARGYISVSDGKFKVNRRLMTSFGMTGTGFSAESIRKGVQYNPQEFLGKFLNSEAGSSLMSEAAGATMIQRYEDVGQEGVEKMLLGTREESVAFAEELQQSIKGKDSVFDRWASEMVTSGDRKKNVATYQAILSMSDEKAAQDMFLTMAEDAAVGGDERKLKLIHRLEEKGIDFTTADKEDIRKMFISLNRRGWGGVSVTQFTTSLGESGLGSGSTGAMSWLEQTMLKSTGFDKKMMGDLTTMNRGALQEMHLVQSVYDKGNMNLNTIDGITDQGRFMHDILRTDAENRRYLLESKGVKFHSGATSAHYTLKNRAKASKMGAEQVLSIPISFEDTNYSGMKEFGGREMLFEIEQIRSKVMQSDIVLSNAGSSAAKVAAQAKFQTNVESLIDMQGRMMSGKNDLRKFAARKVAQGSSYMTARPIGGLADTAESIVYVSKGYAKRMYAREGMDYKDFSTTAHKGKGLMNLHNQYGQDLYAQVSREPVQGPFSSMGFKMMVDTSIKDKGDHIFIPQKNELLNKFAFLDYDADHLRVMSTLAISEKQTEAFIMRNKRMEEGANKLIKLQSSLGVKGGFKELNVLSQFDSMSAKEKHMLQRAELGGLRKTDSAAATTMVLEMHKALDIEGSNKNMFLAERVLAHNLTENLLKSSHKSDASVLRGSVQDILGLQKILSAGGSKKDYADALYGVMNETLGGKFDSMSKETQDLYSKSLRSLADISAKHQLEVQAKGETFLDKGSKKRLSSADAQKAMIEYAGMQGGEGPIPSKTIGADTESIKRGARNTYNDVKSGIGGVMSRNKGLLAAGAAGLFGLAMMSRDVPEQLASTSPAYAESAQPLQPLPDQKGYIRKFSPNNGLSASASVRTPSNNMNAGSLDRALFGDNIGQVSVNVTDKSGMF